MLIHPTLEQLQVLRLTGMAKAFEEQLQMDDIDSLSFEQRLGLLVERESTERASRRLKRRLKQAKLRQAVAIEDLDWRPPRGLDQRQILALSSCEWITKRRNVLITGPTGVGKTFLACALAHKACREGFTALYLRVPRLFGALQIAKGDGSYGKLLQKYARIDLLVFDDWGLITLDDAARRDLLEILEDRCELRSTLVTSQLPVGQWHQVIGDPTLADAILDRLVHNAYKIDLRGDSMRRRPTRPSRPNDEAP